MPGAVCKSLRMPPRNVLLVDDSPVVRKVAVRVLTRLGHRVSLASTGCEAVRALRRDPDVVVVLDVMMDEPGEVVLARLFGVRTPLRVVVQSSLPTRDIPASMLRVASAVLRKPWTARELSMAVQRARPQGPGGCPPKSPT
jgi:CheY-like chemotaxis protein